MRVRFVLSSLLAFAALSGCSSSSEPRAGSFAAVTNASTIALTDVHVSTGSGDELIDATLGAGATTGLRPVNAVYNNVHVTAKVGAQSVSVIPIEGFIDGFNTRLPKGSYVVKLVVHTENDGTYWLEASVVAVPLPD